MSEYTINYSIDGWPICKNGEPIHGNKAILAELCQLQARIKELEEALEEIVHPVRFMQERLEEGERLNGKVAVQLAEDALYLTDIAIAAYRKQGGE